MMEVNGSISSNQNEYTINRTPRVKIKKRNFTIIKLKLKQKIQNVGNITFHKTGTLTRYFGVGGGAASPIPLQYKLNEEYLEDTIQKYAR